MKKSIYLIAPLTLLLSCTGSAELFDDAYDEAKAPAAVNSNEEGYADYIKNEEDRYEVEIEESTDKKSMKGVNPSYYGNNSSSSQYSNQQYSVNAAPGSNYSYGYCEFSCMTFFRTGTCWHVRSYSPYSAYNNYNPYGYNPYGYGYSNYNYGYGWGNNYTCGNGFYNSYYGYGFNNPYYGNYYGFNNPYGGYYGYGYNYYGNPWGYGLIGSYYNNNNVYSNNNTDNTNYSNNHHYGHRGGTNTGSYSRNNTNYAHTVKAPTKPSGNTNDINTKTKPFPAFASSNVGEPIDNPNSGFTVNNSNTESTTPVKKEKPNIKPNYVNTNSMNEKSGSFNSAKPANTASFNTNTNANNTSTTRKVVKTGKPAVNQFSSGSNNTYNKPETSSSRVNKTGTNNTTNRPSTNRNNPYSHPNKYSNTGKSNTKTNKTAHPNNRGNSNYSPNRNNNNYTPNRTNNNNSGSRPNRSFNRSNSNSNNNSSGSFNGTRSGSSNSNSTRSGKSSSSTSRGGKR